jgi:hypothetical protein
MKAEPNATIATLARGLNCCRSTVTPALARLETIGVVEHTGRGKWRVVEPAPSAEPPPKWIQPLSGKRRQSEDGHAAA